MLGLIQGYLGQGAEAPVFYLSAGLLIFATLAYFSCALLLTYIDVVSHRLPDKIVLPMYLLVGLPLLAVHWIDGNQVAALKTGYAGMFLLGIYYGLRKLTRNSLGLGDVKLAGILGLVMGFFSPLNLIWGSVLTFVTAGLFCTVLLLTRRAQAKTHIPFGPFMFLGSTLALVWPVTSF